MKKRQLYVLIYFVIVEAYVFCIPMPSSVSHDPSVSYFANWMSEQRISLAAGIAVLFFLFFIGASFEDRPQRKNRNRNKNRYRS
jgi:hypothetical protein